MRLIENFLYGRRVLVALAAMLSMGVQIANAGPVVATFVCVTVQIAALGFGGAPGSLAWILFSRQPATFPDRREWDGAMHCFIAVTIALFLSIGPMLSSKFVGCSGAFMLLSYGSAKLGCYRLGCCAWSFDRGASHLLRRFSQRVELQALEAALSLVCGTAFMAATLVALDSTILFLSAVATHLGLRQMFDAVRSRRAISALRAVSMASSGRQDCIGTANSDLD